MPDGWEYPWYAAWDLAFHMLPMALVDPAFAKEQLVLLCREWYMHPNGQLPAYEWGFDDVNPPVHAWAAWRVYKIDAKATGVKDYEFLQRVFQKLLMNFTWWVNRKDIAGQERLRRRVPRARQHRPFRPLPAVPRWRPAGAGRRDQLDGDVRAQHAGDRASNWPSMTGPTRTSPPSSSSISSGSLTLSTRSGYGTKTTALCRPAVNRPARLQVILKGMDTASTAIDNGLTGGDF